MRLHRVYLSAMLVLISSIANAAEDFTIHGFGTLATGYLSEDSADYVQQVLLQAEGFGRSDNPSYATDSILGLQLDYAFTEQLTGTAQVVYHQRYDGDYGADFSLALLRWNFDDFNYLRVGRIQNPQFLLSDNALVTFAKPWFRPRPEVYIQSPYPYLDGIAFHSQPSFLPSAIELEVGWSTLKNQDFFGGDSGEMIGPFASLLWRSSSTQLKLAYSDFDTSANAPGISAIIDYMAQLDAELAEQFRLDYHWRVLSASAETLIGPWHLLAEISQRDSYGVTPDLLGGYITTEYQWHKHRPYLTLFALDSTIDIQPQGSPAEAIARSLLAYSDYDQYGVAVGYGYYWNENISLKVQMDYLRTKPHSYGLFINHNADYQVHHSQDFFAYSIGIDFWF